ncbi:kinase-like domain-containing protein [Pisolithus orientalis]|uniref:kinase-like domain-containing protein n=1 Tax=Pisolithus orientalis TaxID=936130 RepID=UPI00222504FA|nr:kinase-like domain-containing protein [Pisolithus orientalis]KAI6000342.1 kinase-like domain-containing protein [Pisolithus orientalis]
MERPSELQELADRASRYSIDLTNRISRNSGRVLPGGSALVYRGTLIPDGTEVAIKTFRCTRSSEADLKLRHENVVRMLGISTEFDSTVSIISEWMPLGDAHAYIQDTTNDPRPLLEDIASGLDYLHNHELGPIVLWRPEGLSSDHQALLSDFGLATLSTSTFTMTVDIKRGGSCHWMAPELLDECPASMESDVWSYGMTALELFTRAVPFPNCRSSANVLGMLMKRKLPPRPAEESTQFRLTDTWWEICMSCWQSDPSLRPTMKDIAKKVKAGISQASPALTLPHKASTSAHPISNEACQYTNSVTSGVAVSYTTTGRALESSALMKTAPEYAASTADTNNPLSSTGFLTCVTTIRQTPPIDDDNDSVNPKGNNVKDNSQPTATAKMPQPAESSVTAKFNIGGQTLPPPLPDREALGSEAARSDSVIGQASESLGLMKTALQDLAADTNMSPSVSLTSNSGTLQTKKNDSVKPKRNNTKEDTQLTCAVEVTGSWPLSRKILFSPGLPPRF